MDGRRQYSADFYAGALHALGVTLVLRLDDADYDPAPFAARGIRICEKADIIPPPTAEEWAAEGGGGAPAAPLPAAALRRFVALAQAAGGAVAVHADGRRLPLACTLAAAWLAGVGLFPSPEAAAAWVAIVRGPQAEVDMAALREHWALQTVGAADTRHSRPGQSTRLERAGGDIGAGPDRPVFADAAGTEPTSVSGRRLRTGGRAEAARQPPPQLEGAEKHRSSRASPVRVARRLPGGSAAAAQAADMSQPPPFFPSLTLAKLPPLPAQPSALPLQLVLVVLALVLPAAALGLAVAVSLAVLAMLGFGAAALALQAAETPEECARRRRLRKWAM